MARDHHALLGYIAARQAMPFAWGRTANDCVSFAAGAVKAQTGVDALRGLPDWSTERGALRAVMHAGGLEAALSARLQAIPIALAHRGDVAGVADPGFPGGLRLMIVEGATLVGPGARGVVRMHREAMIRAWSAGE